MSDIVATYIGGQQVLKQLLDTYKQMVKDVKIQLTDDSIQVHIVDASNVSMAHTVVDSQAFESFDSPDQMLIGVDIERLLDRLKFASKQELVKLDIDVETMSLIVTIDNIEQKIGLIDPDSIRKQPDEPELELPNTVTLTGDQLSDAIDVCDVVSDAVFIRANEDVFEIAARGDVDQSQIEYDSDEYLDADLTEDTESVFSLDVLDELVDPIPQDAEVQLTFGDESPLVLEWEASNGYQHTKQMLAPRIRSD